MKYLLILQQQEKLLKIRLSLQNLKRLDSLYLLDWKKGKVFRLDNSKEGTKPILINEGMEGSADIDITTDGK